MQKKLLCLTFNIACIVSFLYSSHLIFAYSVPYKITDGFHQAPPDIVGIGRVFFVDSLKVDYKAGKLVLSQTQDGTGDSFIPDSIQIGIKRAENFFYTYITIRTVSNDCKSINPLPPMELTQYLGSPPRPGTFDIYIRMMDWCGKPKDISSAYLVNTEIPDPTPSGPKPFLDLPWDYEKQGLSFHEAAYLMTSYFDHTYPLLSVGLPEKDSQVTTFEGIEYTGDQKKYSSHDGYDYAKKAHVHIGDSVLSAASGWATYIDSCAACGNMVIIDHENGYQTRYMHMQKDGLITQNPGERVHVEAHQQIGKVGATGNVSPAGDNGAHIHFEVVQDKDKDGNFSNNIPDGETDPYGWQSPDPDPWENYLFTYAGKERKGVKSYYLWKYPLQEVTQTITPNGGTVSLGTSQFMFPSQFFNRNIIIHLSPATPAEILDNNITSLASTVLAIAKDPSGAFITQFQKPFQLIIDFSSFDISKYKDSSLSIYSSTDHKFWTKELSTIDTNNKKATAMIDHFTYFALMGERKDIDPPKTSIHLEGGVGKENWYRSTVTAILFSDDTNGLGVDYSLFKLDNNDWQQYIDPISVTDEGRHTIQYYSVDQDDNIESIKTIEFNIDKTIPTIEASFNIEKSEMVFTAHDENEVSLDESGEGEKTIKAIDMAGNILALDISKKDSGIIKNIIFKSLKSNDHIIEITPYSFDSLFLRDSKDIKQLQQTVKANEETKVQLIYNPKKNQTTVLTEIYSDGQKLTKSGIALLSFTVSSNGLQFTY